MKINIGDILTFKKKHPCGSYNWEVLRVGQDIRIRCIGCRHLLFLPRTKIEKNIKSIEEKKEL